MFFLNSIENLEFRANKSINNPATEKEKVELRDMEQEYRDMTTVLKYAPRDHMWVEENLLKGRIALGNARRAVNNREKRGKVTMYGDLSEESPETSTETTSEDDYVVRTGNMTVSQTGSGTRGGATQQPGGGRGGAPRHQRRLVRSRNARRHDRRGRIRRARDRRTRTARRPSSRRRRRPCARASRARGAT